MKKNQLVTIDEFVKRHGTIAAATQAAGTVDNTFRRWLHRKVYAAEHSATRMVMAGKGIDLPRPPAKGA